MVSIFNSYRFWLMNYSSRKWQCNSHFYSYLEKYSSNRMIMLEFYVNIWRIFFTGICMRRKDAFDRDALHFAPFLLLPSPFPRKEFQRAQELQTLLNELMHKVAHDNEFLEETLCKTIEVDEFTGRLFKIHKQIQSEGGSAQVSWNAIKGCWTSDNDWNALRN